MEVAAVAEAEGTPERERSDYPPLFGFAKAEDLENAKVTVLADRGLVEMAAQIGGTHGSSTAPRVPACVAWRDCRRDKWRLVRSTHEPPCNVAGALFRFRLVWG